MRIMRSQRGYSLVEMLVVIAIAAIGAAIAGPNLGALRAEYQLTGSASQLAADLSQARMRAVSQNIWVKVATTDSTTYHSESSPDNATFTDIAGTVVKLPLGMSATIPNGFVVFDRQGLANANTQIQLVNGAGTKTITVNRIGRVSIS